MRFKSLLVVFTCVALAGFGYRTAAAATQGIPAIGRYTTPNGSVYVGRTAEPPASPGIEYFDPATQRIGTLVWVRDDRYRTSDAPFLNFDLHQPAVPVVEDKHVVAGAAGDFGFSVWHQPAAANRATIVLLQGADDSTRDMGFLVPYFVSNGMNVVTYDQRGTGISAGSWQSSGPVEKAGDVLAALKSLTGDPAINVSAIGVWAPSNGGWIAPLIATRYPLAFEILKSSSSGTIADNVQYEIRQDLLHGNHFSTQQVADAMRFEAIVFDALATGNGWEKADAALTAARTQPWFSLMRIPPGLTVPPPPPMLAALRASLIFDPVPTLEHVATPTLALYGELDRNVDAAAGERGFRAAFAKAGMRDFTVHVFPGADHLLIASPTGYESDELTPARFITGYPSIMIEWLQKRGFAKP
jgi:alpha-beta hydrolase superfamily lysophospholipase